MKQTLTILISTVLASGALAQGLVNFINTPATLSSATISGTQSATTGAAGAWYYGLLIGSGNNLSTFSFSGIYATNLASPGRFFGGNNVAVPGWAAGVTTNYSVAIWSATMGHDFNPGWLLANWGGVYGYFGISSIATGTAGGFGSPATPAYNLFGGATGIQTGFNANSVNIVPEPSAIALAVLGFVTMRFRRR